MARSRYTTAKATARMDLAGLRGEINDMHAAIRAQCANSSTWAAESRRRFDAIDARLDGLERLVREGFAAVGAGDGQLHGAEVDQEAPIIDTGEESGGKDRGEQHVEEETGEEEGEEEDDDEEAEEESASEYSPDEVIKGKGVYT
jgi:hypothetical protein